jgi:hypothetical protein
MKRIKNYLLIGAGFLALSILTGLVTSRPVIAQLIKAALVASLDDPGRIPYQAEADASGLGTFYFPGVPTGKRLVVTHVSGQFQIYGTSTTKTFAQLDTVFASTIGAFLPVIFQGTSAGNNVYVVDSVTQVYYEPGIVTQPRIHITADNFATGTFHISGYVLDCSVAPCAAIVP